MNQTKKYVVAVDVQLTSPMHITSIEKGAYDPSSQRLSRFDGNGIGCSLTRTQPGLNAKTLDNGSVVYPLMPVIPSSTVSGKLRRNAAELIAQSLVKRGLKISPDAYNVLTSGMANTGLKGDEKTPEVMKLARKDAFLSVFGGTSFALHAHSVIDPALPLIESTRGQLMSEAITDVQPFTELREMTDVVAIVRKNDVADMSGEFLEAVVGIERLTEYTMSQGEMRSESKANKAAGGEGKKTDLRTLNAFEVIRAGLNMGIRVEVTAFEPDQLGLVLLALQETLRDGQIGGKGAKGYGRFEAVASRLYECDPQTRIKTLVASIYGSKEEGYPFLENEVVDEAVTKGQDYLDAISPELLEAFTEADVPVLKKMAKVQA